MDDIVKLKPALARSPARRADGQAARRRRRPCARLSPGRATIRTAEGLVDTPRRVAKAYEELFSGYREDPSKPLKRVFHDVAGYKDPVMVRDISFVSHCEHHIAPFFGKAHIAYYPRSGVVGLSKLARIVDAFARRLQTQEALSAQIIAAIDASLDARGVAVMLEAEHTCMAMRGVRKQGVSTVTTQFSGVFRDDPNEQTRFFNLLRGAR